MRGQYDKSKKMAATQGKVVCRQALVMKRLLTTAGTRRFTKGQTSIRSPDLTQFPLTGSVSAGLPASSEFTSGVDKQAGTRESQSVSASLNSRPFRYQTGGLARAANDMSTGAK